MTDATSLLIDVDRCAASTRALRTVSSSSWTVRLRFTDQEYAICVVHVNSVPSAQHVEASLPEAPMVAMPQG